jgi:hypothetical protein
MGGEKGKFLAQRKIPNPHLLASGDWEKVLLVGGDGSSSSSASAARLEAGDGSGTFGRRRRRGRLPDASGGTPARLAVGRKWRRSYLSAAEGLAASYSSGKWQPAQHRSTSTWQASPARRLSLCSLGAISCVYLCSMNEHICLYASERGECGEKNKTNLCSMFAYYRAFGLNQFSLSHRTFGYAGILKKPEHALQVWILPWCN